MFFMKKLDRIFKDKLNKKRILNNSYGKTTGVTVSVKLIEQWTNYSRVSSDNLNICSVARIFLPRKLSKIVTVDFKDLEINKFTH